MEPENLLTGSGHYDVHAGESGARAAVGVGLVVAVLVISAAVWALTWMAAGPSALAVVG